MCANVHSSVVGLTQKDTCGKALINDNFTASAVLCRYAIYIPNFNTIVQKKIKMFTLKNNNPTNW